VESKAESDTPKELTKTQLAKQRKREKKAEEKQKAEGQAQPEKHEAAHAKKTPKAEKKKAAAPVAQENPQSAKAEEEQDEEEELGDGWERPKPKNTIRVRSPQDKKKAALKARSPTSATEQKAVALVNVPKNKHGQIIGKEGKMLDLIQTKTGAEVKMPKREGGGTGIVISGTAAQVKLAEQVVRDITLRGFSEVTHPGMAGNQIEVENAQSVGRIAGKGAEFLKLIQNKSGAKVQLPDKKSDKQVISIFGKPAEVQKAKEYITSLINLGYCEATHPGWTNEELEFKHENLRRLIGLNGENIKKICADHDVKIDTPKRDDPTSPQDLISIKGTQYNIDQAKQAIEELLASTPVNDAPEELAVPDPDDPWQQEPQEVVF